jgi:hypothetical protein
MGQAVAKFDEQWSSVCALSKQQVVVEGRVGRDSFPQQGVVFDNRIEPREHHPARRRVAETGGKPFGVRPEIVATVEFAA